MGWFSSEKKAPKKNVEIIYGKIEKLEEEIEKRIAEGRIIKDIKFTGDSLNLSQILIIYDYLAEKARDEKEKGKEKEGLGR